MDLTDTEAEHRFRLRLRDWLSGWEKQAPPPGRRWDVVTARRYAAELHRAGFAGLTWRIEDGGQALPVSYQVIYLDEAARIGATDHAAVIGLNTVGPTIAEHGTASQRQAWLPQILRGELLICQGFSEAEAGSDLSALVTRARPVDGGWRLDGVKLWSSYADVADLCLLLARSAPDEPRHRGLTCFLLDLRSPGVEVRPIRQITGEAHFAEIRLHDVAVPDDARLGPAGAGWAVAMTALGHERATFGLSLASRLEVQFAELLAATRASGQDRDPVIRDSLAALAIDISALRWTALRLSGGSAGPELSLIKLRWSDLSQRLGATAWEVLGARAVLTGPDAPGGGHWQHHRLRSRGDTLGGGTSEILRGIIAERVLQLPRAR